MPNVINLETMALDEVRFESVARQEDLRIYNIFTRYFSSPTEWFSITQKAKTMGFNAIYLNPINKTGSSGSLYSIYDYFDWDEKSMGKVSKKEGENLLKSYLNYCKMLGMKVFYDLVINHTAYDSKLVKEHDDWYEHNEDGSVSHAFCYTEQGVVHWEDSAKLNYDIANIELFNYVESICNYYLNLGFSGFRCDAAGYIPDTLWKVLIKNVHKSYPYAIFLGEAFMVPQENIDKLGRAGFEYIFSSAKWWNGYDSWFIEQTSRFQKEGLKLISFPDNHDTYRFMSETNENVALYLQRMIYIAVCSSSFEISYGFEYGFKKKPHVVETLPSDIEDTKYDFTKEIAEANSLRDMYKILRSEGKFCNIWPSNHELVFIEKKPLDENLGQKCLIIMNRTDRKVSVSKNKIHELFVGDCVYKSNGSTNEFEFEPFGIHIFVAVSDEVPCVKENQSFCLVEKGHLIKKKLPIKNLFPDEVLIEIEACGICGSDRREFNNGLFFWSKEEKGGHEFVGKVLQVGRKCCRVKVGDFVANRISRDRECVIQFGGFSKYAVVRENCLFILPSDMNRLKAALIEPLACAIHNGEMIDNLYKKQLAIIGSGTIALLTERYLKYLYPEIKLNLLYKHSQICKYLNSSTNYIEFKDAFSSGMFDIPCRYDLIFECSGNSKIFSKLFDILNKNGKIVLTGIYDDSFIDKNNNISISTMMFNEYSLAGSFLYTAEDFEKAAYLIINNKIKVDDIITTMNFEDTQKAFEIPSKERIKIVLTAESYNTQ